MVKIKARTVFSKITPGTLFYQGDDHEPRKGVFFLKLAYHPYITGDSAGSGCSRCKTESSYTWNAVGGSDHNEHGARVHFCPNDPVWPIEISDAGN